MKFTKPSISVHGNDYLTKLVIEESFLSKNSIFNYCNALFNLILEIKCKNKTLSSNSVVRER